LTLLRQGVILGGTALRRRMLVELELNVKDPSYLWFLHWLTHQTGGTPARGLRRSHQLSVQTAVETRKNGSQAVAFRLMAGPGVHWMKYRGAWMQVRARSSSFTLVHRPSSFTDVHARV
jgi:chaperone BCS1